MRYGLPAVLLVGLLGNPLVVATFAQRRVQVQARLRFYYLLMAVCDWLFLIDWAIPGYLGDGLFFETGGAFYVYLEQLSVAWCKTWRALGPWADLPSDWTKVQVACHTTLHLPFSATAKTPLPSSLILSIRAGAHLVRVSNGRYVSAASAALVLTAPLSASNARSLRAHLCAAFVRGHTGHNAHTVGHCTRALQAFCPQDIRVAPSSHPLRSIRPPTSQVSPFRSLRADRNWFHMLHGLHRLALPINRLNQYP